MTQAEATPQKRSKWPKRLAIMLVSLVVSLGVVEWVVQKFWPVGGCVLGLHETYLFAPIPNTQHIQFMSKNILGRHIVVKVNEQGMLGPEAVPEEQRTRPRLMVFGDSFVMSENEPYEYSYAARMAEHWRGEVEVLCAGVTGYGPDQTLLRMEEWLPRYRPEGVVFLLCSYNDFGDPVRNHLMAFDDGGSLVRQKATPAPDEADWFRERLAESQKPGLARLWINYRRVRGWGMPHQPDATLITDYLRAHREDYQAHAINGETVAYGMLRDVYDADVALQPDWPSSQYKVKLLGAIMAEMQALHENLDIPFYVAVVPGGVDLDPDSVLRIDPARYPSYVRDRLCEIATEQSEAARIPTLNLYPEFERQCNEVDLFEGPVDPHWNRNGMDLGARLTVEFLGEQGWPTN